jgi:hypothetical protein
MYGPVPILLENVLAVGVCPPDPGVNMLDQKVLVNVGIDSFANGKENDGTFPAVAAHHFQYHLLQRSLGVGNDEDARPPRPQGGLSSSDCWEDCRPNPTLRFF